MNEERLKTLQIHFQNLKLSRYCFITVSVHFSEPGVWTCLWAHFTIAEITHDFQWLLPLANVSSQLTDSPSEEPKAYQMLLRFGSRRHTSFLGTADGIFPDEQNIPYFGLCNPFVLDALAAESAVEFGVSNISLIPFLEFYHSNIWSIMALYYVKAKSAIAHRNSRNSPFGLSSNLLESVAVSGLSYQTEDYRTSEAGEAVLDPTDGCISSLQSRLDLIDQSKRREIILFYSAFDMFVQAARLEP